MPAFLHPDQPAVVLAPMEGVTDAPMRALLTEVGGLSLCVSEFLRISQAVPPARTFLQHIPELNHALLTPAGVPVVLQLLGGDPHKMAKAAAVGVSMGATAVDLNFGCPARTVNRHDGGAAILRTPARIRTIVAAVRAATPAHATVSVKLRLGWEDPRTIFETAHEAVMGGAEWLTIHGRTKAQGYRPWANWAPIAALVRQLPVPIIANGDIFTVAAAARCVQITGCHHLMVGRGAVADPALPAGVARLLGLEAPAVPSGPQGRALWPHWVRRLITLATAHGMSQRALPGRIKQWGKMNHLYAGGCFYHVIKKLETCEDIVAALDVWADETRV